ncbi:RNA polymerase factor sigma-54 [Pararhizobium mangrovi]|uniref:RNA polymerase sigma-54 factor n=1 Tax=Pararhizobium mangrovi TaxID=2590452 RepID=A0A506U1W3_9HYPH|nr:RNA polymerase factor sigma-54 [Pararhizobium mangrovi]TPW28352.1 RNA polymerase factor sigma-54 [Pararhizobium mangrovi]
MALGARLQLRQSQSLVMTPQLMQSIRLLQLPHGDLLRFVEEEVERNPLLCDAPRPGDGAGERHDEETATAVPGPGADAPSIKSHPTGGGGSGTLRQRIGERGDQGGDIEAFGARAESLHDHLARQIAMCAFAREERIVAGELLGSLDANGYVGAEAEDLAERLGVTTTMVDSVLARLQDLEPAGVFARSLGECLSLQLAQRNRLDPAMRTLLANLALLARRDFAALRRLCGVDEADLVDMHAEIRALDPKPGSRFDGGASPSIVPDVDVSPAPDGGWHVELNPETLPAVLVDQIYYTRVADAVPRGCEGRAFLDECMQNATWLTRSLDQRARTILKVAREIVRLQDRFLLDGVAHLRPLNLRTVAQAIGMHESTVSRVTANKYMMTPRGVFELKYFFTVSIPASDGGDGHSAETVRHRIRAMTGAETPDGVLSDDAIVQTLRAEGIDIARRTVAKYREAMNIPSSVTRRREKKALARAAER